MAIARLHHTQQVHYLRKTVGFGDDGNELVVGTIPSGSLILKPMSGAHVSTAFNATTTNTLDIGLSANPDDPNLLATILALGTTTFVPLDEAIGGYLVTHDVTVTASVILSGVVTAGSAEVVICYIPDNDG